MARAVSPVVGLTLLIGITVTLGTLVGLGTVGLVGPEASPDRPVRLSGSVSAETWTIDLRHEAGPPIDVGELTLRIEVDGQPLTHQPPIPFFAATGFRSETTGPFNPSADQRWTVGERTSLRIAGTNSPSIEEGSRVTIRIDRNGDALVRLDLVAA